MNTSTTDTHSRDNISGITSAKKSETKDIKISKKYKNDSNSKYTDENIPVKLIKQFFFYLFSLKIQFN